MSKILKDALRSIKDEANLTNNCISYNRVAEILEEKDISNAEQYIEEIISFFEKNNIEFISEEFDQDFQENGEDFEDTSNMEELISDEEKEELLEEDELSSENIEDIKNILDSTGDISDIDMSRIESISLYLHEIGNYKLLTPDEEYLLTKQYAETGDSEIKRIIIQNNLRLVVSIAKRYSYAGVPLLDLIQEGNIGLMKAIDKYDYTKGYKLSTYATWWITQSILRCIADTGSTVRLPVHFSERFYKIQRIRREFVSNYGREPTYAEISKESGLDEEVINQIFSVIKKFDLISLDTPIGDENEDFLLDFIEDSSTSVEEEVIRISLQEDLKKLFKNLTPIEYDIIKSRFGLENTSVKTLEDIGKKYNLTRERVRQIEQRAIKKLQKPRIKYALRDYVNT